MRILLLTLLLLMLTQRACLQMGTPIPQSSLRMARLLSLLWMAGSISDGRPRQAGQVGQISGIPE